jgi:hypothetical protein
LAVSCRLSGQQQAHNAMRCAMLAVPLYCPMPAHTCDAVLVLPADGGVLVEVVRVVCTQLRDRAGHKGAPPSPAMLMWVSWSMMRGEDWRSVQACLLYPP